MRQFRADVEDDLYREIQLAKAHMEADTNAELLRMLLSEVDYES